MLPGQGLASRSALSSHLPIARKTPRCVGSVTAPHPHSRSPGGRRRLALTAALERTIIRVIMCRCVCALRAARACGAGGRRVATEHPAARGPTCTPSQAAASPGGAASGAAGGLQAGHPARSRGCLFFTFKNKKPTKKPPQNCISVTKPAECAGAF